MPDDVKISEMSEAASLDNSAQFPCVQSMNGTLTTLKAPLSQIGTKINEGMTFSNLQTTSKNIVGAINEAAQAGGVEYATELPISPTDPTDTKSYIDTKTTLVKSASGSLIHITDGGDNIPMKSLESEIVAVQDLHGYDKPWVGGAGKNKLNISVENAQVRSTDGTWSGDVYTYRGVTFTFAKDNGGNVISITANGAPTGGNAILKIDVSLDGVNYIINGCSGGSTTTYEMQLCKNDGSAVFSIFSGEQTITSERTTDIKQIQIIIRRGYTASNLTFYPMIRLASETDATFEPYSNICPITGFDSGVVTVTDNDQITNTHTFVFGQTVYGGHFDNKGNLVVTHSFIASYNGETINEPWISSMDNYVPNTLPSIGAQVVYPLTNPITLAIASQAIPTISGENNIFSNCGDTAIEYFTSSADGLAALIEVLSNS